MTATPELGRIAVRHDLRPGDLGSVAALHGCEYAAEWGLDASFEAHVARGLAEFGERLVADPEAGRLWLAEDGGEIVGSIAVTRTDEARAHLRWFVLRRAHRGKGLGHLLLDGALAYARERGFGTVELETFSELRAAAHLYLEAGFELRDSQPMLRWGREIELRHYSLALD
jgi:GNAT superfamily N-acetyltransferase